MDAIIEEFALLAETTNNDAVRLGAIKARRQAVEHRVGLLQATGVLPPTGEAIQFELDARATAERLVAVLNHHNVGQAVWDDIVTAMRDVAGRPALAVSSSNGSGS
jgi:hypothetical protein